MKTTLCLGGVFEISEAGEAFNPTSNRPGRVIKVQLDTRFIGSPLLGQGVSVHWFILRFCGRLFFSTPLTLGKTHSHWTPRRGVSCRPPPKEPRGLRRALAAVDSNWAIDADAALLDVTVRQVHCIVNLFDADAACIRIIRALSRDPASPNSAVG